MPCAQAAIDPSTKYLVVAALGLVSVSGIIVGSAAVVRSLQEKLQDTAKNAAVSFAFLAVVFLLAKAILDS